ncbi:MAG: ribonuclease H-like domain-containing protein [Chromatiales bacterium]|jgi:hypothetical protein
MDEAGLSEQLGGELLSPGLVRVIRSVPLDRRHGAVDLAAIRTRGALLPDPCDGAAEGWLLLDTETSGLAGGTGTLVFVLGMARVGREAIETCQLLLTAFAGERAMLEEAARWAGRGRTLVSFNGKTFDLPLLAARARLGRVTDPLGGLAHLDLLHPVRRAFGRVWPDCRLGTAERALLGFERDGDLPGAEAPGVWLDWLRRRDGSRIGAVLRHNHWDLVSLAALALRLGEVYRHPGRWGADTLAVARAWLARDREGRAREILVAHRGDLGPDGLLELARLHRRAGAWRKACAIWRALAADEPEAWEQLAKYHEHVARDYGEALGWASRLPSTPEHEHRRRRLQRKLAGREAQASLLPA